MIALQGKYIPVSAAKDYPLVMRARRDPTTSIDYELNDAVEKRVGIPDCVEEIILRRLLLITLNDLILYHLSGPNTAATLPLDQIF